MAISSPPRRFAADNTSYLFLFIICASVAHAANTNTSAAEGTATFREYKTTLETLRNHGFTLFTNAIATSDIQIQLLSANSTAVAYPFTLFAPKDVQLFTLDMESSAGAYVDSLRYHVIPNRRLTFADLLNLTSSFLDTLLPQHSVLIGKTLYNGASGVAVDGIRLSDPDLFLGSRFAVHGIDGILFTGLADFEYFNVTSNNSDIASPPDVSRSGYGGNIPEGTLTRIPELNRKIRTAAKKKRGRLNRKGRKHRRNSRHDKYQSVQSKSNKVTKGAFVY